MAFEQTTAATKFDHSAMIKMNTSFEAPSPKMEVATFRYAAPSQTNTANGSDSVQAFKLKQNEEAPQPKLPISGKNEANGNVLYVGDDYVICQIIKADEGNVEIRLPKALFDFGEVYSGLPFSLSLSTANGFRTPEVKPRKVGHTQTDVDIELAGLIDSIA